MQLTKKLAVVLGGLMIAVSAGSALAAITPDPDGKTEICHHTGSATNPIVKINPGNNAIPAHESHGDTNVNPDGTCPGDEPNPDPTEDVLVCVPDGSGGFTPVNVPEDDVQDFLDRNPGAEVSSDGTCPSTPVEPDDVLVCRADSDGQFTIVEVPEDEVDEFIAENPGSEPLGEDGRCPSETPEPVNNGCSNNNSGVSILQSCDLTALLNVLNLGEVNQSATNGGSGSGGSNTNSGVSVAQLANTILGVNALNLGSVTQSVATP